MPVLADEITREGQSKEYNFTMNEDLSEATEIRIYYKTDLASGYWDLTTGVSLVGTSVVNYVHHNVPRGRVTLDVWAKWGDDDDFIRITEDPLIYTVSKFPIE